MRKRKKRKREGERECEREREKKRQKERAITITEIVFGLDFAARLRLVQYHREILLHNKNNNK